MTLVLAGLAVVLAGGVAALANRGATVLGAGSAVLGSLLGFAGAARALVGSTETVRHAWSMPLGSLYLELDPLSAFFLLPVFGLSAMAAIYGAGYLSDRRALGPAWFFTNVLIASMALVVLARNGVIFLVAWETMALSSFFLVAHDHDKEEVREAAWTYFVATHLGTAFLLVFFALLGRESGSLDFDKFAPPARMAGPLFLLAVVGFGTKAGLMPLHVWLPEAHPAAPSHVSALMSGVMIKTGVYGLMRAMTFLGPPPAWWGWLLVAIGLGSGILGILFALAQRDIKRLLAYSSVENVGIITAALGLASIGLNAGHAGLATLAMAGALLHVANHAVFKGLLFMGAGAVVHATGEREMDRLGGLLKRMPLTGAAFVVGAVAICGLPPLNGFAGEILIYVGALEAGGSEAAPVAAPALAVVGGLALIGGLAVACFAKAFGVVFLGEPRLKAAGHEAPPAMTVPMLALAAACVLIGLASPLALDAVAPVVRRIMPGAPDALLKAKQLLLYVSIGAATLVGLIWAMASVRRLLLAGRDVDETVTWDCGYARPTPRMQYTSSSFAQPLLAVFAPIVRSRRLATHPQGAFPARAGLITDTPDPGREALFAPLFRGVAWSFERLRWLQHGRVHLYVLYIALTLVALLLWKLA